MAASKALIHDKTLVYFSDLACLLQYFISYRSRLSSVLFLTVLELLEDLEIPFKYLMSKNFSHLNQFIVFQYVKSKAIQSMVIDIQG